MQDTVVTGGFESFVESDHVVSNACVRLIGDVIDVRSDSCDRDDVILIQRCKPRHIRKNQLRHMAFITRQVKGESGPNETTVQDTPSLRHTLIVVLSQ